MAQHRNLVSITGTGRRASMSLANDPGAARQAASLGQSDVSLGDGLTVDKNQRLSVKQARALPTMAESNVEIEPAQTVREQAVEETLAALINNLRDSGILER